ncbi:lytic murein transglycosylase [Rhizocola hellebori]|uniref:lytic murein transglycosylase n=1 Tax=Rhizocola hellebori TaxID=1392758 RepID=UPI00194280B6|nr:lytic murein transglycosylase [Rhizocola hellebori]
MPETTPADDDMAGWRRLAVTGGLIVALAVASAAAGATMVPQIAGPAPSKATAPAVITNPEPSASAEPTPTEAPTAGPSASATPAPSASPTGPVRPASAFTSWAAPLAGPLGIPQVALEAYGYAEWVLQQTRGTCKLQWTTLAAIGKVTSEHGKQNGSALDTFGRERPAFIGPALNGTGGTVKVADTDGGALDSDQNWDHTIGPMQFIPAMWRLAGVDGDGDELADPQDIDDAALAAAYFLCSGGKDLSVVANWKAAVSAYHGLAPRIDKIFEEAQSYGVRSRS